MAGLYIFFDDDDRRIADAARRLKFFDEETVIVATPGFRAAWVGHDDPLLFGPAFDSRTGVRVMSSGRVSWAEADWKRGESLTNFEGGISNRLLINRYLEHGPHALDRHNGPACVAVWDPRTSTLLLWTDHFGYHPVYLYKPDDVRQTVISTFADVTAADSAVSVTPDVTSMAEFLSAWRITPPHTYYREIAYAGAATRHAWNVGAGTHESAVYWLPHDDFFPDVDAAAEELASAVKNAVRIRTLSRFGPIVSFTSGGMDSRAVLFAADAPQQMVALNVFDEPNQESRIAERLAAKAGIRYIGFARDPDYYPRWLPEGTRLSGSMWSAEDNHFLGMRQVVEDAGARTVITACTTDWLFKGYGLEARYRTLLGKNLPIKALAGDRVDGFLPNMPRAVPAHLKRDVEARLLAWFGGTPSELRDDRDWLMVEDRRIRPACYAVSVSGQIMYRIFPYDTFLADTEVATVYSRSKANWKLNSVLWGKAVRRICGGARDIEDANYGWRVGSTTAAKLAVFGRRWIGRRLRRNRRTQSGLATDGSWPNYGWYMLHSPTLRRLWEETPTSIRDTIADVWGSDPWSVSLADWSRTPNDLLRILTLAQHLERRREATSEGVAAAERRA